MTTHVHPKHYSMILLASLTIFFASCNETSFKNDPSKNTVKSTPENANNNQDGNGNPDEGKNLISKKSDANNEESKVTGDEELGSGDQEEKCISGKVLAIWLDPDGTGQINDQNYLGDIIAYKGPETGAKNYNYFSASAHPLVGPKPEGFQVNTYFYEGSDGLSLQYFANLDEGGAADDILKLAITTSANNLADKVLLSDDSAETKQISQSGDKSNYIVDAHYWKNTDGGVIGPFNGEDFLIQVKVINSGANQDARFYSSNGESFALKNNNNKISSFIISFKEEKQCE